jgi:hypothetical protein
MRRLEPVIGKPKIMPLRALDGVDDASAAAASFEGSSKSNEIGSSERIVHLVSANNIGRSVHS